MLRARYHRLGAALLSGGRLGVRQQVVGRLMLQPAAVARMLTRSSAAQTRAAGAASYDAAAFAWSVLLGGAAVTSGILLYRDIQSERSVAQAERRAPLTVAQEAENMYGGDPKAIYDMVRSYLDAGGARHAEVLWCFARACRDYSLQVGDKAERQRLIFEGYEAAKEAVKLDDRSFGSHKWVAIMMNAAGEYLGSKQQLLDAYTIKAHFERACELNPTDATSRHLLGVWCFTFADMPWYQRKAAAAIFATPPSSSYEEAIGHFKHAETLDPGFYTKNSLYLGKTHLRLHNKSEAKRWLQACLDLKAENEDDKEAHAEAKKLLRHL